MCFVPSPEIETVKLARLVYSKLHEICSSWVKDFPLQPKPHRYYETSIHAIKNMRRKMEDKHVCIPDFNMLFNLEVSTEHRHTQLLHQACHPSSPEEVKGRLAAGVVLVTSQLVSEKLCFSSLPPAKAK